MSAAYQPLGRLIRSGQIALSALRSLPETAVLVFDHRLRFVLAAGQSLRQHGYDAEAIEGQLIADVLPASSWAILRPHYERALEGESASFEYPSGDGTRRYSIDACPVHDATGAVVGGMAISRDITARQAAERAQRRFEDAFALAPVGMALVSPDGLFLEVNDALCELTGHPAAALLRRSVRDVTHPDDVDTEADCMRRMLSGELDSYRVVGRIRRANGRDEPTLRAAALVRDGDGVPEHFVSLFTPWGPRPA